MHSKKILAVSCAAAISAYGSVAQAADVVIGVPNWPSVLATAHVLKVALENNLGLEVELQSGSNPVIFEAMDTGSMHVHPEVWLPNQENLHDTYVVDKKTVEMNQNFVPGEQAMCVTADTKERTGIVNLSDLSDPEMAKTLTLMVMAKAKSGLELQVGHPPTSRKFVQSRTVMTRP